MGLLVGGIELCRTERVGGPDDLDAEVRGFIAGAKKRHPVPSVVMISDTAAVGEYDPVDRHYGDVKRAQVAAHQRRSARYRRAASAMGGDAHRYGPCWQWNLASAHSRRAAKSRIEWLP